jgi:hypothetical protein
MVSRCEFIANRCDGTNQHIKTGECLKTLRSDGAERPLSPSDTLRVRKASPKEIRDRPYENMNITGIATVLIHKRAIASGLMLVLFCFAGNFLTTQENFSDHLLIAALDKFYQVQQ